MFHQSSVLIETIDRQMKLNWHELKDTPFSQFSVMSSEISCIFCLLQSNNMEAYIYSYRYLCRFFKDKNIRKNCVCITIQINTKDSPVI